MSERVSEAIIVAERRRSPMRHHVFTRCETDNETIVVERLRRSAYLRFAKPIFDRIGALIGLILVLPLAIAVAVAIKLDSPGPVFFRQRRTGYLGRQFTLYKFRTMYVEAEELKSELLDQNIFGDDSPDFKLRNDPRVTRLGQWLRKTSIDELPNLLNVLLGDLSLCGPRPTSFSVNTYKPDHCYRLAVTPGITGLWQISGRADVDFDERVLMDITYINNVSFVLDTKILLLTINRVYQARGAY